MIVDDIVQSYEIRNLRLEPAIGEKYMHSDITAPEIDVQSWLDYSRAKIPVWQFYAHGKSILSKKPVSVKINKGEVLYFAENETLGIYVTGESSEVAIKEFTEELFHFYEYYSNLHESKVIGEAQRLKLLYDEQFEELVP